MQINALPVFAWNPAAGRVNYKGLQWGNYYPFYILYVPGDVDVSKNIRAKPPFLISKLDFLEMKMFATHENVKNKVVELDFCLFPWNEILKKLLFYKSKRYLLICPSSVPRFGFSYRSTLYLGSMEDVPNYNINKTSEINIFLQSG